MKINGRTGPYKVNGKALSTLLKCNDVDLYKLKTDFAQATGQPATLSNAQVLDTAGEGVVAGSLTVTDAAAGTAKVASNKLELVGTGTDNQLGVVGIAVARSAGLVMTSKITTPASATGSYRDGFITGTSLTTTQYGFTLTNATGLYAHVGASVYLIATLAANTAYQLANVLKSTGNWLFIKGGAFSSWTLLYSCDTDATATLYAQLQNSATAATNVDYSRIPDTLYPNLVQTIAEDDFSDADGTAISGKALDKGGSWASFWAVGSGATTVQTGKAEARLTTESSGQSYFEFFSVDVGVADVLVQSDITLINLNDTGVNNILVRGVDTNNNVYCEVMPGTGASKGLNVYERTSGTSTLRGSSAVTHTAGTSYPCQVRCVGASLFFSSSLASVGITLSSQLAGTKHGIALRDYNGGANIAGTKLDNFKVYPATGYELLDSL